MLSIIAKPVDDDSTHVTMDFRGDFEELVNATDAIIYDLVATVIESCPEDEVNVMATTFLDRFAHHMAEAVSKKLEDTDSTKAED